jgi:hypothetical protein
METAISTALRHPNVVQTFSFEMVPLKSMYQGAAVGTVHVAYQVDPRSRRLAHTHTDFLPCLPTTEWSGHADRPGRPQFCRSLGTVQRSQLGSD